MAIIPTKHQIATKSWFQRLAVTVLVTGVLPCSISALAQVQNVPITNQVSYTYTDSATHTFQGTSDPLLVSVSRLIDPLGQILGCSGEIIPDYTGFSVAIYEPDPKDPTGTELGRLLTLTRTELPHIPNSGVPIGKAPNISNSNPFFLTNTDKGVYNFLLDQNKGQTDPGRTYIFVINPPSNSIYQQRRVKIQILNSTDNSVVQYVASSLDGGLPGSDLGIALALDSVTLPTTPTAYLSNVIDGDRGQFFSPGATLPAACSGSNTNGAVVVNTVKSPSTLPHATAPGTPTNSYGFVRFHVRVK